MKIFQTLEIFYLGLSSPHVDVEGANAVTVHVGPEPQTQRASASWAGGGELLTLQQGSVALIFIIQYLIFNNIQY